MSYHTFTTDELRDLIQGKFRFCTCLECNGKGEILVEGVHGTIVCTIPPEADPDDYYWDECYDCEGLGGFIHWGKQ